MRAESPAVGFQCVHPFLQTGAAGIVHADKRPAFFLGEINGIGEFLTVLFSESTGHGHVVFCRRDDISAVYLAEAGYDAVGGYFSFIQSESSRAVGDKHPDFREGALIKEIVDSFSGG